MKTVAFEQENCYVCNAKLDVFKNPLDCKTGFTDTPLYKFLESFTGSSFTKSIKSKSFVCQQCFMTLERYDELQDQSMEIQIKVSGTFHRTHTEQIFIKSEVQETTDEPNSPQVSMNCQKCGKSFNSLKELGNHKHKPDQPFRRRYAKSAVNMSDISKDFINSTSKNGINYDFELFQRTFFTENEIQSFNNPPKIKPAYSKLDATKLKSPDKKTDDISDSFKKFSTKHGIDYNLETFQKAFGYSENDAVAKAKKLADTGKEKVKERKTVNEKLVKSLEASGIKYDLTTFQKAFGFEDVGENDLSDMKSFDSTAEEIKTKGYVECEQCQTKLLSRNSFIRHMKSHILVDKTFYCEACSKNFKSKLYLQLHLVTNHGRSTGPIDCPICFKTYTDSKALRSHFYVHQPETKFLCSQCGAAFNHKKSYTSHILIHDDIRPFACTFDGCTKKFRNTAKLKVHLRVHTGEKIYVCPHCPHKRFAQKYGMDLHVNKQHKNLIVEKETCKICGVRVQSKGKMKQHLINMHQLADDENEAVMEQDNE